MRVASREDVSANARTLEERDHALRGLRVRERVEEARRIEASTPRSITAIGFHRCAIGVGDRLRSFDHDLARVLANGSRTRLTSAILPAAEIVIRMRRR